MVAGIQQGSGPGCGTGTDTGMRISLVSSRRGIRMHSSSSNNRISHLLLTASQEMNEANVHTNSSWKLRGTDGTTGPDWLGVSHPRGGNKDRFICFCFLEKSSSLLERRGLKGKRDPKGRAGQGLRSKRPQEIQAAAREAAQEHSYESSSWQSSLRYI